jgi:hypothetical protein
MAKSQSKDCLTLDLKGNLPLEKFEKAIVAFFDLIKRSHEGGAQREAEDSLDGHSACRKRQRKCIPMTMTS